MTTFQCIDAHVGGAPIRLVTSGFPAPPGRTMLDKQAWAARHADAIRRTLMLEPRGHRDMSGAVLTEPTEPGSHAGLLFMHGGGFATMSGHAVLAVAAIARQRGLLTTTRDDDGRVVFDTPAGTMRAFVDAQSVRVRHVPSFVVRPGIDLEIAGRRLRADLAYAGAFYAIVDAESAGVPVDGAHVDALRCVAREVRSAVERAQDIVHPIEPRISGLHGTIFTAPPQANGADLRSTTVFGDDALDLSPGGNAAAAILSVLDAMGLALPDQALTLESVIGRTFAARVASRTSVGDYPAVVPEVEGDAWITGDHTFIVRDEDPLAGGFRLG